jgi:hypothetical protein
MRRVQTPRTPRTIRSTNKNYIDFFPRLFHEHDRFFIIIIIIIMFFYRQVIATLPYVRNTYRRVWLRFAMRPIAYNNI